MKNLKTILVILLVSLCVFVSCKNKKEDKSSTDKGLSIGDCDLFFTTGDFSSVCGLPNRPIVDSRGGTTNPVGKTCTWFLKKDAQAPIVYAVTIFEFTTSDESKNFYKASLVDNFGSDDIITPISGIGDEVVLVTTVDEEDLGQVLFFRIDNVTISIGLSEEFFTTCTDAETEMKRLGNLIVAKL